MANIYAFVNLFQHQTTSLERGRLRIEWSQASSNQVGIDETQRLSFSRQKVTGKCGFASAVWSCNDDDFLQQKPLTVEHFADNIMSVKVMWLDLFFQ